MRRRATRASIVPLTVLCFTLTTAAADPPIEPISGRLVAVGIPGAGAVSAVGTFHPGSPIQDAPAFRALTEPGAVLDSKRILVASTSNFGAPPARRGYPTGTILSIDWKGATTIEPPSTFAAAGGQARTLDGRVIVYTAQTPHFLNRVYNPRAVTAALPPVARPTAISINNAFGRPWFTSMPGGLRAPGMLAVVDPDGRPLSRAPSTVAGGVFSGTATDRLPQFIEGSMTSGALALALVGRSPDGDGRAVFAVLHADGSLVQVHVEAGVDGLALAGTVFDQLRGDRASRAGMVFNWAPDRILYVTDPVANSIAVLPLAVDGPIFRMENPRRLTSTVLDRPVDIAPAVPEVASPVFSSNTSLARGSDLYVVNRGSGTVARIKQDGTVIAVGRVTLPGIGALGPDRLNGIGVSPDADRIWVTVDTRLPGHPEGALIELPAFGAPSISAHR
jgi:hypothetical protein